MKDFRMLPHQFNWSPTQACLPMRCGVGLKPEHFQDVLEGRPDVGFFEVHAENYMIEGGPYHGYLGQIRSRYPLSLHGVGLSIGGAGPLDRSHLDRLLNLIHRYEPAVFSEHLAWTTHRGRFLNDLLPFPYDEPMLRLVCEHIDQTQSHLRRRILVENPATYVEFAASTMAEHDFICEVVRRTGCGLLLDVSNVYVSSINHGRDPRAQLRAMPLHAVGQMHLAGFTSELDGAGAPLLIDSHDTPVADEVWQLYQFALDLVGPTATLLERDGNVPPFDMLLREAAKAEMLIGRCHPHGGQSR